MNLSKLTINSSSTNLYNVQLNNITHEEQQLLSITPNKYKNLSKTTYKYSKSHDEYLIWKDYHYEDLKLLSEMFFNIMGICKRYTCPLEVDVQFNMFSTILFNSSSKKTIHHEDLYNYIDNIYYEDMDMDESYEDIDDSCEDIESCEDNSRQSNYDFKTIKTSSKPKDKYNNIIYMSDCLVDFKSSLNKYIDENSCEISDDINFDSLYFLCGKLYGFHDDYDILYT